MVDEIRGPTAPVNLNLALDVVKRIDGRRRAKGGRRESRSQCAERLLRIALDGLDGLNALPKAAKVAP